MRAFATDRRQFAHSAFLLVVIASLHLSTGRADAQSTPANPTPAATAARTAIPNAQIPEAAAHTDSELRLMRSLVVADTDIHTINAALPDAATQIDGLHRTTTNQIAAGLTPEGMQDLQRQWRQRKDQLIDWAQTLAVHVQAVDRDTTRLAELDDIWSLTAAAAQANNLSDVVGSTIQAARKGIRDTQAELRAQREALLAAATRVTGLQAQATEGRAQLELAEQRLRRDLFSIDAPPLWAMVGDQSETFPTFDTLRGGLEHDFELLKAFIHQERGRIAAHAALVLIILVVTLALSRRQHDVLPDDTPAAVRTVLTRPISATLLLAALLNLVLYPYAPVLLVNGVTVVVCALLARLFQGEARWAVRRFVPLLLTLFLISGLRRLLPPYSAADRLLLLAQDLMAAVWLWMFLRAPEFAASAFAKRMGRAAQFLGWSVFALLMMAAGGNCIGNTWLAVVLTESALRSAFAALGLLATDRVIEGIVIGVLSSRGPLPMRSVTTHAATLRHRIVRLVRTLLFVSWLVLTLTFATVLTPVEYAIRHALTATLQVGAMTLSIGVVLSVAFTIWISLIIARVVRVVLEEDLLPRLSLPRGVPTAISAGANYLILLMGVLVALSAAGIDPGRVALVAGALSVGIGFGLQNVVNNFVSGLILLLERPVQIGDIIELSNVSGQVRRIGIRSSTIATGDGADVIVPNATLISERVLNWTLSSHQRRIEITVGVAYGSDPKKVIEVLETAARETPDVLAYPEPQAVFRTFGDSSLGFALSVWTNRQDILGTVRSRVALAVHDALGAAGIVIPFPQQDVHVRTSDTEPRKS